MVGRLLLVEAEESMRMGPTSARASGASLLAALSSSVPSVAGAGRGSPCWWCWGLGMGLCSGWLWDGWPTHAQKSHCSKPSSGHKKHYTPTTHLREGPQQGLDGREEGLHVRVGRHDLRQDPAQPPLQSEEARLGL